MRRYSVLVTHQFEHDWRQAISAGVVDPLVDDAKLEELAHFLAVDPRHFPMFEAPGESVDLRWINFIANDLLRVQIWYSVVEDDWSVFLESVEIIRRTQQFLPGFDV